MAKEGDPTACWRLWIKKHKATGSEAEVAYAEEHQGQATNAGAQAAKPTEPTTAAPAGAASAAPPAPEAQAGAAGATAAAATASASPSMATGSVLDFCALTPRADSTRFVKQRVVVLSPSGAEQIEDDAEVRSIRGGSQVRGVFAARFPLDRFHNVVSTRVAKAGWATQTTLTIDEVRAHLKATRPATSADEPNQEERFLNYSLGCADYLVIPNITGHKGEWTEREIQTKKGAKRKVKAFTLKLDASLGIFKREGTTFKQLRSIQGTAPTLLDLATDAAAGSSREYPTPLFCTQRAPQRSPIFPGPPSRYGSPTRITNEVVRSVWALRITRASGSTSRSASMSQPATWVSRTVEKSRLTSARRVPSASEPSGTWRVVRSLT
jgi:hypothetical protein